MRERIGFRLALAVVVALAIAPLGAQADEAADNEANCARTTGHLIIFSGTDAGAARRGLNAGTAGCNTADDQDLPFVDTNYLTPGATHAIAAVTGTPATSNPGAATFTLGDLTVAITAGDWRYENSRWESQSILLSSGPGTATLEVPAYGRTHYQKLA